MSRLTIEEIIDHCKRKTKRYEQLNGIKALENDDISNNFIKEYWEHRQVAEYLSELQQYREIGTVEECREARENINSKYKNIYSFCPKCNNVVDWKESSMACFIPEKNNPYPLCIGRGIKRCENCQLRADWEPEDPYGVE